MNKQNKHNTIRETWKDSENQKRIWLEIISFTRVIIKMFKTR